MNKRELEAEVKRLEAENGRLSARVLSVTNEKVELFSKWVRGMTFEAWQAEQQRQQAIDKEASLLRSQLG